MWNARPRAFFRGARKKEHGRGRPCHSGLEYARVAHIYFSGSISGGREDVELYNSIVGALRERGHHVNAGEVTNRNLLSGGEPGDPAEIFRRDIGWLDEVAAQGGLLVAEVSKPSAGVGYEIGYARYGREIPVICLWRPAHSRRCTAMLEGDAAIHLLEYDEQNLSELIERLHTKIVALSE